MLPLIVCQSKVIAPTLPEHVIFWVNSSALSFISLIYYLVLSNLWFNLSTVYFKTTFFISKQIFGFIFKASWSFWYYLDILLYFSPFLNMFRHTSKHMFNNLIIWRTWGSNQSVDCVGCQCISMPFYFALGGELMFSGALSSGVPCGLGIGCDCPDMIGIYF